MGTTMFGPVGWYCSTYIHVRIFVGSGGGDGFDESELELFFFSWVWCSPPLNTFS